MLTVTYCDHTVSPPQPEPEETTTTTARCERLQWWLGTRIHALCTKFRPKKPGRDSCDSATPARAHLDHGRTITIHTATGRIAIVPISSFARIIPVITVLPHECQSVQASPWPSFRPMTCPRRTMDYIRIESGGIRVSGEAGMGSGPARTGSKSHHA
ncbi:hypothetical protein PGQ11_007958 [Apiospora arundinis]|uniref:Uncharacterized protein n=1 Tax=Apiospora arundinis TaxID=335852 RepID=A0ABR2IX64_9PEZI